MHRTSHGERIALAAALAVVVGCGPGNSPVTVAGVTLSPKSSLMFSFAFPGVSATGVVVTDDPDICATLGKRDPCAPGITGGSFGVDNGTALVVGAGGTQPGKYPISAPDGGLGGFFAGGYLAFSKVESGRPTVAQIATSGTISLDAVAINDSASGTYDVTLGNGEHIQGTFAGRYCSAFSKLFPLGGGGRSCSHGGGGGSNYQTCTTSCTCQQKTVSAECTQSDGGPWSCTCTNASGQKTTCAPTGSGVCSSLGGDALGCCPLSF